MIENSKKIVEWCENHFASRDTKYNKRYFWEVKGNLYFVGKI
jgi:hypothetical protein